MSFTIMRADASLRSFCFALALVAVLPASSAFAAGGSSGGGGGGGGDAGNSGEKQKTDLTTCERGKVWNAKAKKCLPQHSGVLPDDQLADYAYALAKAERFEEALDVLNLSQDSNTPKALNYRGYVTRKLGRIDEGVGYYLKSVALDPNYAQVREYLGEAYVIQGKFDLAKEQLSKIKTICGSDDCEEYEDLQKALTDAHNL
jgi:tetratricopeptide (TPR) repeat protein